MRTKLLWIGLAVAIAAVVGTASAGDDMTNQRQPVLVELFTSEGCSSCPPADALLEKLDREQPIAGAQIIVLSEHVDYWNHLGWTDPFSSAAFSARQETYARRFGLDGPYTPEMVVDGGAECNGSDARKAESAIQRAIGEPKVGIRMRAAASGDAAVTLEVDPLPEGTIHKANIYVGDIQQVGSASTHAMFTKQLPMRAGKSQAGSRLIAFVQEAGNGRVWGAAMYAMPQGGKP
jgi:hypothetical protein